MFTNSNILKYALSSKSGDGSVLACAFSCTQNEECVSFFYNSQSHVCTIHSRRFWETDLSERAAGCLYYTKRVKKRLDCFDILKTNPKSEDGEYTVQPPDTEGSFKVYCDMSTDGGGWTVFQRRRTGAVSFSRNWTEYKNGFGNISGEFWLGNDALHRLTSSGKVELRIDMSDQRDTPGYAKYSRFRVGNEKSNYLLNVAYSFSNKGDSLMYHNGMMFSTVDKRNDRAFRTACVSKYQTGWWFKNCMESNLNGVYNDTVKQIFWWSWYNGHSLKKAEMKLRPTS